MSESTQPLTDGYIKYHSERIDGVIPDLDDFQALSRCRTELFDLQLLGQYPSGIGYGNVSLRVSGTTFLITGNATSGTRVLAQDHYALVEAFDLNRNRVRSVGKIAASSEALSHGAIYQTLQGVKAVFHIHSRRLFDFMREARYPETPPAIPFGTPELGHAITALLRSLDASGGIFVTAGHEEGIIAYGETLATALSHIKAVIAKADSR